MRFTIKISLVFICAIIWSLCFGQTKVKAELCTFLSPAVVVNKADLQKLFSELNVIEKIVAVRFNHNQEASLTEIFGQEKIEKIFDVATGNGSWMRDSPKQPWAAYQAYTVGFDLEEPDVYAQDMRSIVSRATDWQGLKIVHSKDDPFFPEDNSLDLIHEAFMDVSRFKTHEPRLNLYNRLLKDNGWMLFAHVSHKYYIQPKKFTDWLDKNNYAYQVLLDSLGEIPDDYPRTYWWNSFKNDFSLGMHSNPNYLIIAQKMPLDHNNLINQCDQSI